MAIKINRLIVSSFILFTVIILLHSVRSLKVEDKMTHWKHMKTYTLRQNQLDTYILPKIIWTYWHDEALPEFVSHIQKQNRFVIKDWSYIMIHESTLNKYIQELPPNYSSLRQSHKADWLRLALLEKYGGCWLDATVMVNSFEHFETIYSESIKLQSEFTGFYTPMGIQNNDPSTFIESWFIIAPKNSRVIKMAYEEFTSACVIGFDNYRTKSMKENLLSMHIYNPETPQDIYLTVYAAIQIAIHNRLKKQVNIILYNSYDTMYKLHYDCWNMTKDDYDSQCIVQTLKTNPIYVQSIPFLKFTRAQYSLM
jgi:hypothetical protein